MAEKAQLQLDENHTHKALPLINPTRATFRHVEDYTTGPATSESEQHQPASDITYKWTSRNNRKGRHAIAISPSNAAKSSYEVPAYSNTAGEILKTIWRMATYYPVWDVSWLVAYIYTVGSVVWVFNGFFVFYPDLTTVSNADSLVNNGGGITAFIGATIFEVGSVLLIVEAFNAKQGACFGWALERAFSHDEKGEGVVRAIPSMAACHHHHQNRKNLVGKPSGSATESWTWWPTSSEFRQHYIRDIGFMASAAQLVGASIFWISGFTALPGIYNNLSSGALLGAYWIPQIIGGSFFIISGALFMVETQKKWWQPELTSLGWHIGLWNMIGGVGFTLCPAFGLDTQAWAQYQSACSTFWGGWAFLLGSTIQWYESLNKNPVERSS